MDIFEATTRYEAWLGHQIRLLPAGIAAKHDAMAADPFSFFRATYYRWAQLWPEVCEELARAHSVLGVADLHVENFGTWRDLEGRLVWGVNDFDEAAPIAFTNDLVRLIASVDLAARVVQLELDPSRAARAILSGYADALKQGGEPLLLAEHHAALRSMATYRLKDPERFWKKLLALRAPRAPSPGDARAALAKSLPRDATNRRIVQRQAGLGSLGRVRLVALAQWQTGWIAREIKALAPAANDWARGGRERAPFYAEILRRAVRVPDPCVTVSRNWIVRRLAPDCTKIELDSLPRERDEFELLYAMGWETANVHLGSASAAVLQRETKRVGRHRLERAVGQLLDCVHTDWNAWRKGRKQ